MLSLHHTVDNALDIKNTFIGHGVLLNKTNNLVG